MAGAECGVAAVDGVEWRGGVVAVAAAGARLLVWFRPSDDSPFVEVGFYRVLPGLIEFSWVFTGFYLIILVLTETYLVISNFNGFYLVFLGFTGFYWILPSFTGFYLVLLGFT